MDGVARSLSSFRSQDAAHHQKQMIGGLILPPLMEGPDPEGGEARKQRKGGGNGLGQWLRGQFSRNSAAGSVSGKRSELWQMIGVLGSPLAPIRVCSSDPLPPFRVKDTPIVSTSSLENDWVPSFCCVKVASIHFLRFNSAGL